MFGTETEQELERRRSRMFLILGGLGALALAIAIVMLSKTTKSLPPISAATPTPGGVQAKLEGALRSGNPDFDTYRPQVTLEDIEAYAAPNALGMTRFTVNTKVTNRGSKQVSGLEIEVRALGLDGKSVLLMNTNRPIPYIRKAPLKPGETVRVSLIVDAPSKITENDISSFVPAVSGLILQ